MCPFINRHHRCRNMRDRATARRPTSIPVCVMACTYYTRRVASLPYRRDASRPQHAIGEGSLRAARTAASAAPAAAADAGAGAGPATAADVQVTYRRSIVRVALAQCTTSRLPRWSRYSSVGTVMECPSSDARSAISPPVVPCSCPYSCRTTPAQRDSSPRRARPPHRASAVGPEIGSPARPSHARFVVEPSDVVRAIAS